MRCRLSAFVFIASLFCAVAVYSENPPAKKPEPPAPTKKTVYDYSLVDMDGKIVPLSTYKGKVLLIVNLASQSMYSNQVTALNELQKTYASQGLVVVGIPSSDFGGEELKDPAEVRKYYSDATHADFPVYSLATVTGVHAIPLYQFLCDPKQSVAGGDLHWNFTKFLIDRDGKPLARYEVATDPAEIDFHVTIESALVGKLKPKSKSGDEAKGQGGDDDDDDE